MSEPQTVPNWTPLESRFLAASRILSIFACVLGVLGLIGWWRDIALLRSFSTSFVPINPITAVCLVLCGLSVLFGQWSRRSLWPTYAARLLAAAAVFFGVGRAIAILSGFDFGVDLILFRHQMPTAGPAFLGRMAIGTAVNFILLGCALLFLNSRSRRLWALSEWLIPLTLGLTVVPLADYLYGSNLGTISSSPGPLAVPTILGFLALCLAVLFSQPRRTQAMNLLVSDTGGGRSARRLLPVAVTLLFAVEYFSHLGVQKGHYEARIANAFETVATLIFIVAVVLWNAKALRRSEEALLAAHRDLEQKVRERTRALSTAIGHLKKLNRFYSELSQLNQVIVRTHDRQQILSAVCQIAVKDGLFRLAWIGLTEEGSQRLKPVAWAGVDEGYLEKIHVSVADTPEGRGPMGTACRENRQSVVRDVETDPIMTPWREEALLRGYRSVAAFPLREGERAVGAIGFYSGEPDFFQQDELRLLEELADDISFALAAIAHEEALLESERRFRILFEEAMDGIVLVDSETHRLSMANPQMCRMLGYSPEEVRHLTVWNIHPAGDLPLIQRDFSAAALGQRVSAMEVRVLRKDGSLFSAEVKARVIEVGKQRLVLGVFRDITERTATESALRASEEKFAKAFQASPMAVMISALADGRLLEVNDGFSRVTGYTREEAVGKTTVELNLYANPADRARLMALLRQKGSFRDVEADFRTKGGEIRSGLGAAELIEIDGVPCLLSVVLDITERKKAEEELRKSEGRFRLVWEHATDGMRLTDGQGTVLAVNEAFCRMVGKPRTEVEGYPMSAVYAPTDQDRILRKHVERFASREVPAYLERQMTLQDGRNIWLEVSNCFIETDASRPLLLGVFRDVTDRKRAEQRMSLQYETTRTLAESATAQDAIRKILQRVCESLSWEFGAMWNPDHKANVLRCVDVWHLPEVNVAEFEASTREFTFAHGVGLPGRVWASGQPAWIVDVTQVANFPRAQIAAKANLHGAFAFPVWLRSEMLGVMEFFSSEIQRPDEDLLRTMSTVGKQIGQFIDRQQAEEELHKSEDKYHRLIENVHDAIIMDDVEGRLVYANRRFREWFGLEGKDISKVMIEDNVAPEWRQRLRERHDRRVRGEPVEERFEYEAIQHDGKRMWLEVFVTKVVENGRTVGTQSVIRDITERRSAEQRIRILSEAVERSPSLTILTDEQARIVYANPKFTEVTGYTLEEVVGQNPRFLKGGQTPPDAYRKLWQTLSEGGVWRGEFHNRKKNGEWYWAEAVITALRNDAGKITHYLGVQEDITERKQMEEEKRMLGEQFRQAQKMEAVGRLAGGVAHDFNNLLNVIIGYSELVAEQLQPGDPLLGRIQEVLKAGNRATALTRQLLAFSRQQVLQPRVLNLNSIVEESGKMLRRLIGEDVEMRTSLEPALGHVMADPGQLEQVIMNLAVNARDAMPEGGKLIIKTANVSLDESYAWQHSPIKPGRFIKLEVSDTGIGMDKETQSHIFEPFFTTKERGKGTGLGLATVYGIVKQSGGFIWVYSEPGNGTTFKIYLPRADEISESAEPEKLTAPASRGSETILLVEDEVSLREMIREMLEAQGYTVLESTDPLDAVKIAERHMGSIHLLVTDVVMPGMSGRTVADRVRHLRPNLKVLYISGYTDDAIVHHGVLEPGLAFLQKPFSREDLTHKVREILQRAEED